MIFNRWEPVSWRQLKTVYDLPEIDEKVSLFHYVNDVILTNSTKLLDFEATIFY